MKAVGVRYRGSFKEELGPKLPQPFLLEERTTVSVNMYGQLILMMSLGPPLPTPFNNLDIMYWSGKVYREESA